MAMTHGGGGEGFPATHWSLVALAGEADSEARREALGQLLGPYLPALQAHLVHHRRLSPEKADDLLQEFITSKIIEKDLIARADRQLGRLRTFLLTAMDRFVQNQLRNERVKKRAPADGAVLAFDERHDGSPIGQRPSEAFDVAWARGVIAEALRQMRDECELTGRPDLWGVFQCRVVLPTLEGTPPVSYAELVRRFRFHSPSQASNALTTAKRMYARALRSAIARYAVNPEEVESELIELKRILAKCGK